jgi:hypothetical protein
MVDMSFFKPTKKICENCRFYSKPLSYCERFPPIVPPEKDGSTYFHHQKVFPSDTCGEFKKKRGQ